MLAHRDVEAWPDLEPEILEVDKLETVDENGNKITITRDKYGQTLMVPTGK
jgi:hypothetical protein